MAIGKLEDVDEVQNLLGAVKRLIKSPPPVDINDANQQLIDMGLTPVFHTVKQEKEFLVLPENWPAVRLFTKCNTQWKKTVVQSMTGTTVFYDGLDYLAINTLIGVFYPDENKTDLFERLQILEYEALSLLNEKN